MNPFADMEKDTVIVERDGVEVARYMCIFVEPKLTVMGDDINIAEGDRLSQVLPNGRKVDFDVEDVSYQSGLDDMCGCVFVTLEKVRTKPKKATAATTNHITINSSSGIQIGNHNIQNLEIVMRDVLSAIEKADATPEVKAEARSRLQKFLEHPLVASAVGAALPAAIGLIG
jgi:hypothetical protein